MKTLLLFSIVCSTALSQVVQVPPRRDVPQDVMLRARKAVQVQVDKTLRNDFEGVVEKTNPEYLKVLSRALKKTIPAVKADRVAKMRAIGQQGVTVDAMITLTPKSAFEVDYGFEDRVVDGKRVKVADYRSWLVFVPTVMDISILDKTVQPPKLRRFRKWSFEAAITKKNDESWTFVNGEGLNALELRKLFKFLPQKDKDLNFPVRKIEELK
ncbi:MAG: hypothetical protein ACON38_06675 [Akkermansiaceae bacterium]